MSLYHGYDKQFRLLQETWKLLDEAFNDNAYVWDVDDTLYTTKTYVIVKVNGNPVKKLTPSEFNTYNLNKNEEYDFKEFKDPEILFRTAEKTKYFQVLKKMNDAIKEGRSNSSIYILTARTKDMEQTLLKILNKHGITEIKKVYAVNENPEFDNIPTIAEKKKHVLNLIRNSHSGKVTFFDDDLKNIELSKKIKGVTPRHMKLEKTLNEWFKVHEYSSGTVIGKGTYGFEIGEIQYIASVNDSMWKTRNAGLDTYEEYDALDVSFGVLREGNKEGNKYYWVDYESTINEVDATDVIATVLDIAFGVAEEEMPEDKLWLFSFNPTKDKKSQSGVKTKRSSLYKRITSKLAKEYGWEMVDTIRMDADSVAFVMKSIKE